jgi:hypothetical protein
LVADLDDLADDTFLMALDNLESYKSICWFELDIADFGNQHAMFSLVVECCLKWFAIQLLAIHLQTA